jgi:hypothetical protein
MQLNVPVRFTASTVAKYPRSWGVPSRLIVRPTDPIPAQLTSATQRPHLAGHGDRRGHVLLFGHVGSHERPADLGRHRLTRLLVEIGNHDPGAGAGEPSGSGGAQAGRAARDDADVFSSCMILQSWVVRRYRPMP